MSDSKPLNKNEETANTKRKRLFWKGKLVSQKVYNKRVQQTELARKLHRGEFSQKSSNLKKCTATSLNSLAVRDSNETFSKLCRKCKSVLSLKNVKEDQRHDLKSKFDVECQHCHTITTVWANCDTDTAVHGM